MRCLGEEMPRLLTSLPRGAQRCDFASSRLGRRLRLEPERRERLLRRLLLRRLLRRAAADAELLAVDQRRAREAALVRRPFDLDDLVPHGAAVAGERLLQLGLVIDEGRDRESTRLNSSHGSISYAVFCLQKTTMNGLVSRARALTICRAFRCSRHCTL